MAFVTPTFRAPLDVLHPYHSWRSGLQDDASRRLLRFKDGDVTARAHYARLLDAALPHDARLVVVPGHAAGPVSGPLAALVHDLVTLRPSRVDASGALVRSETVVKASHGGLRSADHTEATVAVARPDLVAGFPVVLLDDVTTTGASFEGCLRRLLAAGAASVCFQALARTPPRSVPA